MPRLPELRHDQRLLLTTALASLGLHLDEEVRFRRDPRKRWETGHVRGLERDGSLALVDAKGASRSVPMACVEVGVVTRRGARRWEPLADRACRTEQLALFG